MSNVGIDQADRSNPAWLAVLCRSPETSVCSGLNAFTWNSITSQGAIPMKNLFNRFAKDESGATAIEYGLIAALIAVVCITIWTAVGDNLIARFTSVNAALAR